MKNHGTYTFKIEKDILYTNLIGSFNLEGVISFSKAFIEQTKKMPKKYYSIVNFQEFEGAVKEGYEAIDLFVKSRNNYYEPPLQRIIIIREGFTKTIVESEAKTIFNDECLKFEKMQDALDWINGNIPTDS